MIRANDHDGSDGLDEVDQDLLDADRELDEHERRHLMVAGAQAWEAVMRGLTVRARRTYSVAKPEEFRQCVSEHMDGVQRMVMVNSEVYHCAVCGRLLKDRGSPVASGILAERRRLAGLLADVEKTTNPDERTRAWRKFRAALGLTR